MKKLLSKEPEGGAGSNKEEEITVAKSEYLKLVKNSDELKTQQEEEVGKAKKIEQLEKEIAELILERDESKKKYGELEKNIRNEYYENLSDEHRKIAELIPGIEGLRQYVKLNISKPPAGSDSARPGAGTIDSSAKWDELTYNEKEELRKKRPEMWRKLYREKFGFN